MPMLKFADTQDNACTVHVLSSSELEGWRADQPEAINTWIEGTGFTASPGTVSLIPGQDGTLRDVLVGAEPNRDRKRFALAAIVPSLPDGVYRLSGTKVSPDVLEEDALGWLLSQYSFERFRRSPSHGARLICPEGLDGTRLEAIAAGEALTRDLINTPANHMGPAELEQSAQALADNFDATLSVLRGADLLKEGFPLIHTVGRASASVPRLLDMNWGTKGPQLVLVGKGVCFDTGGLNIKPGASMGLMKKDMGGAATVLGLAKMIMALDMPLRLRVLIPAVENAIDGSAFRPQDILTSRKGLTVEINNTDAEGRLVLADALALADETPPDLMICMATLTGAARVAVGPDIAPFYTDQNDLARALEDSAVEVRDPVWRMPFHAPYEAMIDPGIADLDNAPKGGFAGSITAALFLRRFVEATPNFVHFDIYGWQPASSPARPKGGVGQGARAILQALPKLLDL